MKSNKQIVIVGFFLILFLGILFFNVISEYQKKYNITQKELVGLQKIKELHNLKMNLKIIRGASQFNKKVFNEFLLMYNIDLIKIEKQLKDQESSYMYDNYFDILKSQNKITKGELFHKYTVIIQELNKRIRDVSDSSYLLFEPDREKYFLMVLSVLDVHTIAEAVGIIRGKGSAILRGEVTSDNITLIQNNKYLFLNKLNDMKYTLSKLESKNLSELINIFNSISSEYSVISNDINAILDKTYLLGAKEFFIRATNIIQEIDSFFLVTKNNLIYQLQEREKVLYYKKIFVSLLFIILNIMVIVLMYILYQKAQQEEQEELQKKKEDIFLNQIRDDYSRNLSLKQICDVSLNHLIHYFKALNGSLYILDHLNNKLYLGSYYGINKKDLKTTLNINDNYISENILEKKVQIIELEERIELGNVMCKSSKLVTLPIIDFDTTIGTIQLTFDESFKEEHSQFLQKVTSIMASYINKAQRDESVTNYIRLVDQNVLISKTDLTGNIIEVSEELCTLSQYKKEDLIGNSHSVLRHTDMPDEIFKDLWKTIKSGRTWKGEMKNKKRDGTHYWVDSIISPDKDINGNIIGYTALRHNITDKKVIEEIAVTDKLTTLYNRRHFDTVFPAQIAITKRNKNLLVFVLIDIDHFKQYNDTYGHQAGDETLQLVAKALKETFHRPDDFVFRLGGEEFGLVYHVGKREDAKFVANKARENVEFLEIEHTKNSASNFVTISAGLYIVEADSHLTPEQVYKRADELLYQAKEGGRNQVVCV